jgi:hypothetical protein
VDPYFRSSIKLLKTVTHAFATEMIGGKSTASERVLDISGLGV